MVQFLVLFIWNPSFQSFLLSFPKMADSTHVTDRKCTQGFDRNIWREETTLKI